MDDSYKEIGRNVQRSKNELATWVDAELNYEVKFISQRTGFPGDAIGQSGKFKGKTIDFMGLPKNAITTNEKWIDTYDDQLDAFLKSVDRHFKKMVKAPPKNTRIVGCFYA